MMNTQRAKHISLADIHRSQMEEIRRHKWIESEKAGYDIGWHRAANDWMQTHYQAWRRYNWEQAINEALRAQWDEEGQLNGRN